jgi:PadR family transcriptional regulator PadR
LKDLNQQFKKGILEILVLKIICDKDIYGYDLIKKLEFISNGFFILKEGSLYPVMYRLEDQGLVQSYRKDFMGERKVPRKYYRITKAGKIELNEMLASWKEFTAIVENMLGKDG